MLKKTIEGVSAGILISIGGSVFLSCENRIAGAILFSVALLCICLRGYSLFTGKVGFMVFKHGKEEWSTLLLGLLGNFISTCLLGYVMRYALPAIGPAANSICMAKLTQLPLQTFIRAFFCGILMYLAVCTYRENNTLAGIFFCVPVFILSGFEHSIANLFYFSASGIVSLHAFGYLWLVILGNALGGMLLPALSLAGKDGTGNG